LELRRLDRHGLDSFIPPIGAPPKSFRLLKTLEAIGKQNTLRHHGEMARRGEENAVHMRSRSWA
jgi:hypothetical protein